ncbi:MAG: hypothetical protein SGARI_000810 [Bacillariaceae sp.]
MKQRDLHATYRLLNLAALQKLDDVLKAYDIEYWASGGTLLGALRHQGFVPHDDDIDIECHAADLERMACIPVDGCYLGFQKGGVWKGFPVYKMKFRGDIEIDIFPRNNIWVPTADELEAKHFPTYDEVFPIKTSPYCNIRVPIPNNRKFLHRLYGKDCFENVCVWNHDFNFEHGMSFEQRKVVVPLDEYNSLLNEGGIHQLVAGKTAEETYENAFRGMNEDEYLGTLQGKNAALEPSRCGMALRTAAEATVTKIANYSMFVTNDDASEID